jgi:hypothetical protein
VSNAIQGQVYALLTSDDDGRVCLDIPDEACEEQPRNFLTHVISLSATKVGDGLADPKLVLSWLLGALGAPAYLIGLLVPLREAGALLPQLFISGWIRSLSRRKWVWAAGSFLQGFCVVAMSLSVLALEGAPAGWAIVALLAVFACARSACSVSYKDVLGKTVSKSTRGTATGTASSLAAAGVLLFGGLLSFGILEKSVATITGALFTASGLWIGAAAVFTTLQEKPGATEGGGNPFSIAIRQLSLLKEDRQLVLFIATRGLLIATALAPPYMLALAEQSSVGELGQLGAFVTASALAAVCSTYVWGRLSDLSSRKVLMLAAVAAALVLGLSAVFGFFFPGLLRNGFLAPVLLFALMISYQGVRLGRATHVVDMTDEQSRAAYTALSNSIVGALLMAGGLFGIVAQFFGAEMVLAAFAIMSSAAYFTGRKLQEVQSGET